MSTLAAQPGAVSGTWSPDAAPVAWWATAPVRRRETTEAPAAIDPADARDVEHSLRGDGEAFTRLVQRHQARVARRMWRFTRDREEHEELVQDVFVSAFTSLPSYRDRGSFRRWLDRIAVRTGYACWRRRARERSEPRADVMELLDQQAWENAPDEAVAAAEAVHQVLARLSPRDRLVLTLMVLDEHTVAETAELTGWSESLVKVQAWRARARLRKLLDAEGGAGVRA